jgi:hypothetical protein
MNEQLPQTDYRAGSEPNAMPELNRVVLYPFEHFDVIRRKWIRARYVATLENIAMLGDPFRIVGQPEIREGPRDSRIITENH